MKVIQIGNGNVAKMHRGCFVGEATVIAIIEIDPVKRKRAEEEGFSTFPDIVSLPPRLLKEVDLWDICIPDESHVPIMEYVLGIGFKNILVEKPICVPSQTERLENLLRKFPEAQICVEETYTSSEVVRIVREQSEQCGMTHPRILMEQSKNRMQDIINGRFIDKELGVFALEVPHSLTAVAATGEKRRPSSVRDCDVLLEAMELPSGEMLPRQGWGAISYFTEDGCEVEICSAMDGKVLHPLSEIDAPTNIPFGSPIRYRILILEEGNTKIIGQFEPITGLPRFVGRMFVYKNEILRDEIQVEDRPMNRHIAKAIHYFQGKGKNPAPPLEALSLVNFLSKAVKRLGP